MLDRKVLKTEERLVRHMSFLPQEVVWWDVWIGGSSEKAQLQMMISMARDVVYCSTTICGLEFQRSR
jgi:hypothetical protein